MKDDKIEGLKVVIETRKTDLCKILAIFISMVLVYFCANHFTSLSFNCQNVFVFVPCCSCQRKCESSHIATAAVGNLLSSQHARDSTGQGNLSFYTGQNTTTRDIVRRTGDFSLFCLLYSANFLAIATVSCTMEC